MTVCAIWGRIKKVRNSGHLSNGIAQEFTRRVDAAGTFCKGVGSGSGQWDKEGEEGGEGAEGEGEGRDKEKEGEIEEGREGAEGEESGQETEELVQQQEQQQEQDKVIQKQEQEEQQEQESGQRVVGPEYCVTEPVKESHDLSKEAGGGEEEEEEARLQKKIRRSRVLQPKDLLAALEFDIEFCDPPTRPNLLATKYVLASVYCTVLYTVVACLID
jgi:hypothetical protein